MTSYDWYEKKFTTSISWLLTCTYKIWRTTFHLTFFNYNYFLKLCLILGQFMRVWWKNDWLANLLVDIFIIYSLYLVCLARVSTTVIMLGPRHKSTFLECHQSRFQDETTGERSHEIFPNVHINCQNICSFRISYHKVMGRKIPITISTDDNFACFAKKEEKIIPHTL